MARMYVRCENEKDGVRCIKRNLYVAPKGVALDPAQTWKCDSCLAGNKPFEPRGSVRKGQQKQKK